MSRRKKQARGIDIYSASKELLSELHPLISEEISEKVMDVMGNFVQGLCMPLLVRRQVLLIGDINQEASEDVSKQMLLLSANVGFPIDLFINSRGGDIDAALQLCDVIRNSETHVRGTVLGQAHSAAFLVLQSCHKRLAYRHATLLLHGPTPIVPVDNKEFGLLAKLAHKDHNKILREISERSKQPFKFLHALSQQNQAVTALKAKRLGFIDEIIEHKRRR